ncbi:MAG TPA: hypothetical protein VGB66_07635 [Longimicrobium sp.]|jgi:lipid-A-disaccharide synthase-like uncharacterized protein
MAPNRREADRKWVQVVGWIGCVTLAGSLTYTFVKALTQGAQGIDPLFFGMQTIASLFFLVYSLRTRNRIFVAANCVALLNAVGTLVVALRH